MIWIIIYRQWLERIPHTQANTDSVIIVLHKKFLLGIIGLVTLSKAYNAGSHEDRIYKEWEASGLFTPKRSKNKKPFTIMMPPPNATGTLHLGHAVMLALQDVMTRYHRMKGDATLWLPGTDHASIATQNKVERILAEKGESRHSLGRPAFLKEVHKFVKESQKTIKNQVRKMGSSCDWTRERYTLDPELSTAVREAFVRMYEDGLIYRGNRIVNWCPRCSSTLADDEVVYKEERGNFYYLKYGPFTIGTSRPETKFLDKIIVVHPDDKRYKKYHGKTITVPWIHGDVEATILADKAADPEFGTGAMTITPAHDFIDFEIAQRHKLEVVQIIDEAGNLTEHAGEFAGMNARDARGKIITKLARKGLVEKIDEEYVHNLSICYRCDTPIEPLVSRQWFIDVDKKFGAEKKSLKKRAIEVVRTKKIQIVPERFDKTYFHWMENLHDWCISRQIWFGHEIPVWYCTSPKKAACEKPIVSRTTPKSCPHCDGKLKQDPDTLDTWFSSGTWTFTTLGWPKRSADLDYFHPTSVLETGYDILFFWVARMILMTSYLLDEIPFKTVYLHGLVRTREGKKMSKSHPETCIDPLDMITTYGADSLRLSMIVGSTPGNDLRLYEEKIAGFRNFVNKVWNASRFALMQVEEAGVSLKKRPPAKAKTLADQWILTRTQELIDEATRDIESYSFSEAGTKIYDFTWNEYCAWYLEISKGPEQNIGVLLYVLETLLKLLHPFIPYVTEVIWKELGHTNFLMAASWPKVEAKHRFKKEARQVQEVIEVISAVRSLRQENNIPPSQKITLHLSGKGKSPLLEAMREPIVRMARLSELTISTKAPELAPVLKSYSNGIEITVPLKGMVDLEAEITRIEKELSELKDYLNRLGQKLSSKEFTGRAPAHIVEAERGRQAEAQEKYSKLEEQLASLKKA